MAHRPSHVTVSVATDISAALGLQARLLLGRAVPAHLVDDRFDAWTSAPTTPSGFCAALATLALIVDGHGAGVEHEIVGYLGGGVSRGRFQLDGLIDPTVDSVDSVADDLLAAIEPGVVASGADRLELWGRPAQPWHDDLARRHGLAPLRSLHQMRCPLPIRNLAPLPTRAYRPSDLPGLVLVNNRAFAAHPDQGGQSADDVAAVMAEPWFQPEGLRIHERNGRIAGFCWTKIHDHADPARRLGEIFVIGVDPDFHGQGMGGPMTAAGLAWLHDQGLGTGMLYVEADNEPAVRTYHRLGFTVARTDRAWDRPVSR
jgi:mycothiol synthase